MLSVVINSDAAEQQMIAKEFGRLVDTDTKFIDSFENAQKFLERNTAELVLYDISNQKIWEERYDTIKLIDLSTKIILLSENPVDAVKAFEVGAVGFLLKPVSEAKLSGLIKKITTQ